jgi:thiamine biosynthesis protein ThiI
MPIYRPVFAFDKQDIVDIAEKVGTYEISIQPYEDCCTTFVAKHPVTKPTLTSIQKSETHLVEKIDEMVQKALDTVEIIEVEAD